MKRTGKWLIVVCALTVVFAALAGIGFGRHVNVATLIVGIVAILGWGATATAVPPMLQSAAMRHSPEDPDGASGLYVAAFQVGIMAGSLLGGLLFEHAGEPVMLTMSAVLIAGALAAVVVSRDLFAVRGPAGEK